LKIKLLFNVCKGSALPFSYNHIIASFIYRTIEESSSGYSTFLHDNGYVHGTKQFKLFTFSQLQVPHCKIDPPFLHVLSSEVTLYLSSPVKEWTLHFITGIFEKKRMYFGGNPETGLVLEIVKVETLPEPDFNQPVIAKTLSPITVSTGTVKFGKMYNVYLDREDKRFCPHIRENLVSKYRALYDKDPASTEFAFSFDEAYIRRRNGKISKLIDYNGTKIRGYAAPLTMEGSPDLLRIAYYAGLGEKNSLGFGCLV
jgi:CRISPR-associated endoribonuclease Cas6